MLFFGYFSCLIVAFTAVAMWLTGSFNNSTLEKHHHPRPTIDQTVTAEGIAPLHLQVTKETSRAKDDVLPSSITNPRCSPVSATTTKDAAMATRLAMPKNFGTTQEVSLFTDPAHE
jgi:hypothetical protein